MPGRNPPFYCTLTLIAMQGHQKNKDKGHDEPGGIELIFSRWVSVCVSVLHMKDRMDVITFILPY